MPGEAPIYTQIFKARPEVNSIVHAHAPMCIVMGLAEIPISGVHLQSARFGEGLPVYPLPVYCSDVKDGNIVNETIGDAPGMTISGHGIVTIGRSIDEATFNAIYMERTAKIEHAARLMGFQGVGASSRRCSPPTARRFNSAGAPSAVPGRATRTSGATTRGRSSAASPGTAAGRRRARPSHGQGLPLGQRYCNPPPQSRGRRSKTVSARLQPYSGLGT